MIEEKSMSEQRKIIHDDNNGLDYVLVGDYYMPMLDCRRKPDRLVTGEYFGKNI